MTVVKEISLREANQSFARLIREVEAGQEVVITRRGQAVAKVVPVRGRKRVLTHEQKAAWEEIERVIDAYPLDLRGWKFNRDELYDDMIEK